MDRRLGILTFEGAGGATHTRQTYVWDIKNLTVLRWYADYLRDWTRADLVEGIFCARASIIWHPDRDRANRRQFLFHEPEERQSGRLAGTAAPAYPLECSACLWFREETGDGTAKKRQISWPAPLFSIVQDDGQIDPFLGNTLAHTLEQATGRGPITYRTGYIKDFSIQEDLRI